MSENVVGVSVKERWAKLFSEEISQVDGCVNALQMEKVAFYPFTDDLVFDIHMTCPGGRFLCHCHCCACVVVLI